MTTRRLAVQDDPRDRKGHHSGGDRDEIGGPIPPVPAPQANLVAILQRDDPSRLNPAVAVRHLWASTGRAGRMKPDGCSCFGRTQRIGVRINIGRFLFGLLVLLQCGGVAQDAALNINAAAPYLIFSRATYPNGFTPNSAG